MVTNFCKQIFKAFAVVSVLCSLKLFSMEQPAFMPNVSFAQTSVPQSNSVSAEVKKNDAGIPVVLPSDQVLAELSAQQSTAPGEALQAAPMTIPVQATTSIPTASVVLPTERPVLENIVGGEVLKPKDDKDISDDGFESDIYLNFDNASLGSIVNYLGEQKKINIIPHKDLAAANVTMSTRTGLTLERAWNVLLTLLEMNGFSIVKVGNVYRVVSNKDNKFEPLPMYSAGTGTEPESLPDSDEVVRYVYLFKNIKAELARDILSKMLEPDGTQINSDLNACIIKEKSYNIKAAMKIVKELDQGGLSEQIKLIQLQYANADNVATLFQEILQPGGTQATSVIRFDDRSSKKERAFFSSSTKMFPEPIKNRLILLGNQKNLDKITEFIYKYIDVPLGQAESRLHIKEIRYAKAEDLKPILEDIIKRPSGQGSEKSTLVGEYKFFEDVVISAEKAGDENTRGGGNRLIIACNKDDWKRLEKLISKMDKPQPQVALEVMILNVDANQDKMLGSQHYQIFGHRPGMGINSVEFRNLSSGLNKSGSLDSDAQHYIQLAESDYAGNGYPTFVSLGKAATQSSDSENIWSMIKAYINVDNSNIVAQPFLVTNNNQPCRVEVTTAYRLSGELDSRKGEPSKQKIVETPAITMVEITPKMNLDGVVDMDIKVEVDEWIDTNPTTAAQTKRSLKTKATMLAGEVLSLGGLTKRTDEEDVYKTPILGDIPIIGSIFFKNKQKTQRATNLYIFIRPSIIKPRFEGSPDEYTQLKLDYAKYQLLKNDTYLKDRDPIQRWFFKPPEQSIKQKLSDAKKGVIRPLDDFVFAKSMPRMVNIRADSYYKVSEELAKYEDKLQKKRQKEHMQEMITGTVTLN